MSRSLAVDVVLLPPADVMEEIIRLIDYADNSVIQLNQQDCLPHLSLAMGVLQKADIAKVGQVLEEISRNFQPIELEILQIQTQKIPDGKLMSGATIKNTEQLTHLHLDVMSSLHPYLTHSDVQTHMFTSPPVVADVSTTWVQHYFDEQGPESFHPHITLGEGKVRQPERPVTFTAARLALCHLGSYCTCRKILTEHILA